MNLKFIKNRNTRTNIYRIQAYDILMCVCVYAELIGFMIKGKSL